MMTQTKNDRFALSESLCKNVFYYDKTPQKNPKCFSIEMIDACAKGQAFENLVEDDYFSRCDEDMRRWFQGCLDKTGAEIIFFSYPSNLSILPKGVGVKKVIELFDTDILNWDMQQNITKNLLDSRGNILDIQSNNRVLSRSFLRECGCKVSREELAFIHSFDAGIALTIPDEELLKSQKLAPTARIPIMMDSKDCEPDYELGHPCLMLGPNYFNLQGLLHFDRNILPRLPQTSAELRISLYGSVPESDKIRLGTQIENRGFAPCISTELAKASFFINPVFSGTGMQIKTIEAMAHGLAVVCYEEVAVAAGIVNGQNGLVAKDESDFARGIDALFNDRVMAAKLGQNARSYVEANLSRAVFDSKMAQFMADLLS
jgi:hypothetical protein